VPSTFIVVPSSFSAPHIGGFRPPGKGSLLSLRAEGEAIQNGGRVWIASSLYAPRNDSLASR
jgi:hypothetical protein